MYNDIINALQAQSNPVRATHSQRFFKTGPGEYGEGDKFIGLTVPQQRKVAKQYKDASLADITHLLGSPIHEHRLTALFILVGQYKKASLEQKEVIVRFYLEQKDSVNNWDLVDSSAPYILGDYLCMISGDHTILLVLARSQKLWDRRIAIVSTLAYINQGTVDVTFDLSKLLLNDHEDLIHKATGWMLREAGKKDEDALKSFLNIHATQMPRTMLRYAIEKFDEQTRKRYLTLD